MIMITDEASQQIRNAVNAIMKKNESWKWL
jgi:hypothetical protein